MSDPQQQDAGSSVLHWRDADGIAQIRFNRPQALNAIDTDMAQRFLRACSDIAADREVRAVWISGEGRAFMAGGDLAAMRADPVPVARTLIEGMHGGLQMLARIDAPVIASVHGAVAGAGLGVALSCDMVIAAEGTRFSMAYPLVGASSDCSTSWYLPRVVGLHKAMEIALLGDAFDAAEALRLGICNRVVPMQALQDEGRALAARLANGPTRAYGRLRRLMRASLHSELDVQLDAEADAFLGGAMTADFAEGVDAFLGKRPAKFEGR